MSPPSHFAAAAAADLTVESIIVPEGAVPGETVDVIYDVRNIGSVAATAPWTDRIYIDSDDNIASARTLTSLPRNFELAPGESYEVTTAVTIPSSYADGDWRLFVRAAAVSPGFGTGPTQAH